MKVLWVVNSILRDLNKELFGNLADGVWMDALLSEFKGKSDYSIVVVTTAKRKTEYVLKKDNVTYYLLPDAPPISYNENKKSNIACWKALLEREKPDLIQVWGTEFTQGLCALRSAKDVPSVIYMQGYLGSIARFYQAGIPQNVLKRTVTVRDFLKRDSILQQQKKFARSSVKEREMFALSGAIISENEWCNANIRSIVPDIKTYFCPLSINKVFGEYEWNEEKADKYSVICTASGYTIKGLHILLRAIALLKTKFPDIKLYVPGTPVKTQSGLLGRLKRNGYTKYVEELIEKLGIKEQVIWLGRLSQKELAEEYSKRHVFVMPSSIENHSSSLKEAMAVGMPCISSYVGGIPEYLRHGENGLLYRFEEYEVLASHIEKLFVNKKLCERLSAQARNDILKLHDNNVFERICKIYEDLICKK